MDIEKRKVLEKKLDIISKRRISPFDLIHHSDIREKLVELTLHGVPESTDLSTNLQLNTLKHDIEQLEIASKKVVVFGGGSGLSNVIGGDCRIWNWAQSPFGGLKEVFPEIKSIVCVTDDGGSTGELLKDLPLVALGDIRHVLLSSVQLSRLIKKYGFTVAEAHQTVKELSRLFNYRYKQYPLTPAEAIGQANADFDCFPKEMKEALLHCLDQIYTDSRLINSLKRPQCLGNLILVGSIYNNLPPHLTNIDLSSNVKLLNDAVKKGLGELCRVLGVSENGVLPCTSTPAQLRLQYSNGVQTRGESKSGSSKRGYPVKRVFTDYVGPVQVYPEVLGAIRNADIIIMAPGSLYSSIIPIFQVKQIADAVKENKIALKILISNLWAQAGETDLSPDDPSRKFHVSDMLTAYEKNIPGGTEGLFHHVLCLSLKDVPASILQRYAVEGKIPIYLDKHVVKKMGYLPIECGIFSRKALGEHSVIQHDPCMVAKVIKTLYITENLNLESGEEQTKRRVYEVEDNLKTDIEFPFVTYNELTAIFTEKHVDDLPLAEEPCSRAYIQKRLVNLIWKHHDIPLSHLAYFDGIQSIAVEDWHRDQKWDNVYSFYDPDDRMIKIREDQFLIQEKLELALLIALGESLLGNYAKSKETENLYDDNCYIGKIYRLHLRHDEKLESFFTLEQIVQYLKLGRMYPTRDNLRFTRVINGEEGFTPPGLLMGLLYAWYLDNRLATHVEYKMSLLKIKQSTLIPEQLRMQSRREQIIQFLRDTVFK